MGHDDDHGVARCLCKFVSWVVGAEGDGILRHVAGKLVLPAVDPADREGKRRQRQHDGPADVAGAKQQHRRGRLAEPFVERRPGEGGPPGFRRRRDASARTIRPFASSRLAVAKAPDFSISSKRRTAARSAASNVSVSVRTMPPQHWPRLGPNGQSRNSAAPRPAASVARARAMASYSRRPPPIVPKKPPSGCSTMRAPLSRGTDPAASITLSNAALPCRSMVCRMRVQTLAISFVSRRGPSPRAAPVQRPGRPGRPP